MSLLAAHLVAAQIDPYGALACARFAGLIRALDDEEAAVARDAIEAERGPAGMSLEGALRVVASMSAAGLTTQVATLEDPAGMRAARDRVAFDGGRGVRACAACGVWSVLVWREGRCACGAERMLALPGDPATVCPGCDAPLRPDARHCEACGRGPIPEAAWALLVEVKDSLRTTVYGTTKSPALAGRAATNDIVLRSVLVGTAQAAFTHDDWGVNFEDLSSPRIHSDGRRHHGRVRVEPNSRISIGDCGVTARRVPWARAIVLGTEEAIFGVEKLRDAPSLTPRVARYAQALEAAELDLDLAPDLFPSTERILDVLNESRPRARVILGGGLHERMLRAAQGLTETLRSKMGAFYDGNEFMQNLDELVTLLRAM